MIGWFNSQAYFLRFNFGIDFKDGFSNYFLFDAFPIVIIMLLFLYLIIKPENNYNETKKGAFCYNMIFLTVPISSYFYLKKYLSIFIGLTILFLYLYIWVSYEKISLRSLWFQSITRKLLVMVGIFVIFLILAGFVGYWMATEKVEGNLIPPVIIQFSWKENPPPEIKGEEFVFLAHLQGNYFVFNRQKPAPDYVKVYIIPENMIKFAILKR